MTENRIVLPKTLDTGQTYQMTGSKKVVIFLVYSLHTSPQASINLENSPREVTYVFRRPRGHIRRPHCQSNQIIQVFGDF